VIRTYTERGDLPTLAVGITTIDTRTYDDGSSLMAISYNNGISESRAYNTDNTLAAISFTVAAFGDLPYGWNEHALVYRLQSATENKTLNWRDR
jgi:hypothetical protein